MDRAFRINEPPDAWPEVALSPDPQPAADCAALCARLDQTARGDDPAAFEQAVCDAFAALGFVAVHLGGEQAPDGYADAALGPLQYRAMLECKTAKTQVTQPDCFEASKYRQAYGADFCLLVGPAFGEELALISELQTHGVSAWTVADLQELLHLSASAQEMRPLFAPGFAADALADLAWRRAGDQRRRGVRAGGRPVARRGHAAGVYARVGAGGGAISSGAFELGGLRSPPDSKSSRRGCQLSVTRR